MKIWIAILSTLVAACGHSHDDGDHGHAHGNAAPELPGQSVTTWAQRTELFMEYAPLIAGKETRFAAHVTEMPSFKAVTAGSASVALKFAGGTTETATADAPTDPGIFRPKLTPKQSGACELVVSVKGPQVTETFSAGKCQVFPDEATARKALGEEEEPRGRISFLKEQQWKTDFAVVAVAERDLQDGVRASGEIRPIAGREAKIAAPVSGRVELATPAPLLGMPVKPGMALAAIAPRAAAGVDRATLAADVAAMRAELEAARAELARAQRLVADQAAPAKLVDEAKTRAAVAEARLAGASGRLAQFEASATGGGGGRRFELRAPIEGTLVAIDVATGETVEEGRLLFDVVDLSLVWLVARVFEPDVPRVEGATKATFTIEGYDAPFAIEGDRGKLVTIGRVVDPKTRTVPVIFEVDNRDGRLRIGNFTKVAIATGAPRTALAVPESSVIDDAGKAVAYVMLEGESFERRPLRLGIRSNGWIEVLDGVARGERVVSKGAYEVKLSAASGAVPAHGHAH